MTATVTFAIIKNRIRFEADFENATAAVVDPTRLNEVANGAMRRVWALLLRHRPDHCLAEAALATTANSQTVSLPAAFQQLRLLEILDGSSYVPMSPYALGDQWRLQQAGAVASPADIRYRIQGTALKLAPTPTAVYELRLYYLPTFTPLVLDADTFDGINGFEDLVIAEGVLDLLRRRPARGLADVVVGFLLGLQRRLARPLGHAATARDQVDHRGEPRQDDQEYHPHRLDPARRLVVAPKQVGQDLEQHQQVGDPGEDDQEVPKKIPGRTPVHGVLLTVVRYAAVSLTGPPGSPRRPPPEVTQS